MNSPGKPPCLVRRGD